MQNQWETVIGLEIHAQVLSNSKLFSFSSTAFGSEPNSQVSFFDAAMPGMLPVINSNCIAQAVKTGLAISGEINFESKFDRKNYFYPDLPQGYQITQFYEPIVRNGRIILDSGKMIKVARIHLEQDAGKSIHQSSHTYVDLNRAGIALMEIVSEPDLRSADEAAEYVKKLRTILRYIGSCDGDMEKGSFRCDANVSVRLLGSTEFGSRCEIKNLNSIRYITQAIEFEAKRQIEILEAGGTIEQNTLLFDVESGETRVMRSKEDAGDYRYFPDPDILPVILNSDFVDAVKKAIPELPSDKKDRYVNELGLSEYDARVIISDHEVANYFEQVIKNCNTRLAASWIAGELFAKLNKLNLEITNSPVGADELAELISLIESDVISGKIAKQVFAIMFETGESAKKIVQDQGMQQLSDESVLRKIVGDVLESNAKQVADYRNGKDKLFGFFVGQVMKKTEGKANPETVNSIIKELLQK